MADKDETFHQDLNFNIHDINADISKQENKERISNVATIQKKDHGQIININNKNLTACHLKDKVYALFQSNIYMLQALYHKLKIDFTFGRATPCNLQEQELAAIQSIEPRIDNKLILDQNYMNQLRFGGNDCSLNQVQKMLI